MSKSVFRTRIAQVTGGIGKGLALMTAHERKRGFYLVISSLFYAFLQTAVLVSIIPMIQFMIDPAVRPGEKVMPWLEPLMPMFDDSQFLFALAFGVLGLILFKALYSWLHIGWMSRYSANCEVRLMSLLMKQVLTTHYTWLVQQNSTRLRELLFGFVTNWSRQFIRSLLKLINDLTFAAIIVAVLIWANPLSGIIVFAIILIVSSMIFLGVRPELLRLAKVKRQSVLKANSISIEAILGIKEVKMAGVEDRFGSLFSDQISLYAQGDAKGQQWSQIPRILLELIAYGSLVGISVAVILFEMQSAEFAGLLLLYSLSALRLMPIFSTVVSGFAALLSSFPIIDDLETLISETKSTELADADDTFGDRWREIKVDDVSLSYEGTERAAVQNISLAIEPGKSYGAVGPSGAGKSTLIDLISGLLQPTGGSVSVDGEPLVIDSARAWRRHFGYVSQRPFLLDASMRENIVFGSMTNVDENRLARAVHLARLDEVVARLPKGLSSRLGEQGNLLSGGERQRVAIARALYRGADILVLDEATSSLDTIVEREISETIATLHGKITTIIVSHRLGLVRDCDEIWLFDNGQLNASGSHEQLLEASELYRRMVA